MTLENMGKKNIVHGMLKYNRKPPGKQIQRQGFELQQASMDTSTLIVDIAM